MSFTRNVDHSTTQHNPLLPRLSRKNVTNHVIYVQNRKRVVNAGLAVGIIFWSAFVSGIQTLSEVDTIAKVCMSCSVVVRCVFFFMRACMSASTHTNTV